MSKTYELIGVGNNGNYRLRSQEDTIEVSGDKFYIDRNRLNEELILQSIGQEFVYYESNLFYCGLHRYLSTLFNNIECERNHRVPISSTYIQNLDDLRDCFISNRYYSSMQGVLTLGLVEAGIRSSFPSALVKNLPIFNKNPHLLKKNSINFGLVHDFFKNSERVKENFLVLQEFNLNQLAHLQAICNKFSVGIYYYYFQESNLVKEFRLPETPEISPIPLLKILQFAGFYFLLYAPDENKNDGYSETGIKEHSYQCDELASSFYMFQTESYLNESVDFLTDLLKTVTENPPDEGPKIKKTFNDLTKTLKEKKANSNEKIQKDIDEMLAKLDFFNTYIEKKLKSSEGQANSANLRVQGIHFNQGSSSTYMYPSPSMSNGPMVPPKVEQPPPQNTMPNLVLMQTPINVNNNIPGSNLNRPSNNGANNPASATQQPYTPPLFDKSGLGAMPPTMITYNNLPGNNLNTPLSDTSARSATANNYGTSSQTVTARNSIRSSGGGKLERCTGCNRDKAIQLFHGTCRLCNNCIALSIMTSECVECNSSRIRDDIVKFKKNGFTCNGCGNRTSDFKVNDNCMCIICQNCIRNMKFDNHRMHN